MVRPVLRASRGRTPRGRSKPPRAPIYAQVVFPGAHPLQQVSQVLRTPSTSVPGDRQHFWQTHQAGDSSIPESQSASVAQGLGSSPGRFSEQIKNSPGKTNVLLCEQHWASHVGPSAHGDPPGKHVGCAGQAPAQQRKAVVPDPWQTVPDGFVAQNGGGGGGGGDGGGASGGGGESGAWTACTIWQLPI
jgi:hypothetical protein